LLNFPLELCLRPSHQGRVEANQPSSKTTPAREEPININLEKTDKIAANYTITRFFLMHTFGPMIYKKLKLKPTQMFV